MAAPRMKPPAKKKTTVKKAPKKVKVGTVKSPEETRKSISRKQVGTSRPAKGLKPGNVKDLRNQFLKRAATSSSSAGSTVAKGLLKKVPIIGSTVAKGLLKKVPIIGTAIGFIADASPAGESSTVPGQAQKAVEKRMKREIRQGTELAVTGVKTGIRGSTKYLSSKAGSGRPEYPSSNKGGKTSTSSPFPKGKGTAAQPKKASGFGKRISEGAKFERLRASRAALGSKSSGSDTASSDVKAKKSSTANTAATTAAASSDGGTSKAASAGGKTKRRPQTRFQRESLYMETRRS